jgi:hypothetical protein
MRRTLPCADSKIAERNPIKYFHQLCLSPQVSEGEWGNIIAEPLAQRGKVDEPRQSGGEDVGLTPKTIDIARQPPTSFFQAPYSTVNRCKVDLPQDNRQRAILSKKTDPTHGRGSRVTAIARCSSRLEPNITRTRHLQL